MYDIFIVQENFRWFLSSLPISSPEDFRQFIRSYKLNYYPPFMLTGYLSSVSITILVLVVYLDLGKFLKKVCNNKVTD